MAGDSRLSCDQKQTPSRQCTVGRIGLLARQGANNKTQNRCFHIVSMDEYVHFTKSSQLFGYNSASS